MIEKNDLLQEDNKKLNDILTSLKEKDKENVKNINKLLERLSELQKEYEQLQKQDLENQNNLK